MKIVLDEGAILPTRAHPYDAGLDLYSREDAIIHPNVRAVFDTGVHVAIPEGYCGYIKSRSGLMCKKGLIADGTIDSGYTGSIGVILFNLSGTKVTIKKGEKIAQLVIHRCELPELEVVETLEETERSNGGFGSTGRF